MSPTKATLGFKKQSIHNMFYLDSFVHTEQTFAITNSPSITLSHITVNAKLTIDEQYHNQIRRIMKKSSSPIVQIQLLFAPNNVSEKTVF